MSATRDVTIWCDGDNGECGIWETGDTAKEIRAHLASVYRWAVSLPGGQDFCPRHAPTKETR